MADFPPALPSVQVNTIPSYLYTQYNDDDNLQAFVNAYNGMAQTYVTWFANAGLPIYTQLSGALLDWMAQGLYGITRQVLSAPTSGGYGPLNTFLVNNIPINSSKQGSGGGFYTADDDTFQRIITWHFYKGDGKVFSLPWLKRRILRFLYGSNGQDIPFQTTDLSEDYTVLIGNGYINPAIIYVRADDAKTYFDITGTLLIAGVNVWPDEYDPVTHAYLGKSVWPTSINEALHSAAPATQTITLAVGTYTLWGIGSGSVASSAGTAVGTGFGTATGSAFSVGTIPAAGWNTFTLTTAGTVVLTVSGTLSYMQCESSAFPTTYIPTTTAAVTRNADNATIPSASIGYSGTGTFVISAMQAPTGSASDAFLFGPNATLAGLFTAGITQGIEFDYGGVGYSTANQQTPGTPFITAASITPTAGSLCLNGGTVLTVTQSSGAVNPDIQIGAMGANVLVMNGWLGSIALYPGTTMTPAQLQTITTTGFIPEIFPDIANTSEISVSISGDTVNINLSAITGVSTQILDSFEYAINGKILELPPQFAYTVTL